MPQEGLLRFCEVLYARKIADSAFAIDTCRMFCKLQAFGVHT